MLNTDHARLAGHLDRCRRLGWPVPGTLRRAAGALLARRGYAVRNRTAPAAVLALALLVSSLPADDVAKAAALLKPEAE